MNQKFSFFSIFRVDGNSKVGLGHIMRCIGLAQSLLNKNIKSIFITKKESKTIEKIMDYGFSVITLPEDIDILTDALKTKKIAQENKAKLIFTDIWHKEIMPNPNKYIEFLSILNDKICVLIAIDGPPGKYLNCDLLIVPYLGIEELNFQSKRLLLGSKYFIFRKEFIDASKEKKTINKDVKMILISMGGSDPEKLSILALNTLLNYNNKTIQIIVVIGKACPYELINELEKTRERNKETITLIKDSKNMAKLLLDSDILITNDGLTKYEASIIGTPMIILSQMNHQDEIKAGFYEYKSALFVDINRKDVEKELLEKLELMVKNPTLRQDLSNKSKECIDGKGIDRIFKEIKVIRNEKNC